MVCSAVAAFDFDAGALILVVSFATAPRARRYCFTASFHCVPISESCLAAHSSSIILINFCCACFPGFSMNSSGYFYLEVSRSGVEVVFLFLYPSYFSHFPRGCTLFLVRQ